MATIEGSFMTMPSPRTYTRVLAVPRTTARSSEKRPARKLSNMAVRSHLVATHSIEIRPPQESNISGRAPTRSLVFPRRWRDRAHVRTGDRELWQHGATLTGRVHERHRNLVRQGRDRRPARRAAHARARRANARRDGARPVGARRRSRAQLRPRHGRKGGGER